MHKFGRLLTVYAVAIPLALMLGYLAATPDVASIAVVGLILFILLLPIFIQNDHWLLIFFWNSAFIAGFLPGAMPLWVIFAWVSFFMGLIHLVMSHRTFLRVPELTKPILFLLGVVVLTGRIRGGLGLHVLGSSSYGGKNYFLVITAIVGYFALTSQRIRLTKSAGSVKSFFLSGLSYGVSNLLYTLGPAFYFLFLFIPSDFAVSQASADYMEGAIKRIGGLGPAATSALCFILAHWGLRGVFVWHKPWRMLALLAILAGSMFSGFRSTFFLLTLILVVQFFFEGLWKTAFLPGIILAGVIAAVPLLLFANKMPASVQRTMAFLPVDIDPSVRADAEASTDWRVQMWREVWPDVPKYLLIGKGYAIDPLDLYLTGLATRSGLIQGYEGSLLAGDYHNGPLSIIMPFGIFGAFGFLWLLAAGVKVLYSNYLHGDARLKLVNTLILSFFVAQALFFLFVYGAFNTELAVFLGLLGFSVSLNGGVCRRVAVARPAALATSRPAPAAVA